MYKIRVVHRSEQTKDLLCLDKILIRPSRSSSSSVLGYVSREAESVVDHILFGNRTQDHVPRAAAWFCIQRILGARYSTCQSRKLRLLSHMSGYNNVTQRFSVNEGG